MDLPTILNPNLGYAYLNSEGNHSMNFTSL